MSKPDHDNQLSEPTGPDTAPGASDRPARVVVFIDAQNMYMGAREAFGWTGEAGRFGNFRPLGCARRLAAGNGRVLTQVRVYTGIPTPRNDPKGNAATQRRIAAWIADDPALVEVFPRPLRYPPPRGREKGVDVELAIDLVDLAIADEYDVVVLASADTDLVPALELARRRCPQKTIETVGWEPLPGREAETAAPIDIRGEGGVLRRTLNKTDFDKFADKRDFLRSRQTPESLVGKSRWQRIKNRL